MALVTITVENDADFYRQFQYVTLTDGLPIDMTGCTLEMMLRVNATDVTAVLRFGTDTGELVLVDPDSGIFSLYVAQAVLEQLPLNTYDHSLIMTVGPRKTRIWSGTFTNNAGATR